MFGELFRKLFGVRHVAPVTILPPLARPRLKAPPLRPHHRRAAEVRAAVACAPQGLSWRRLIAYVREQTGTGCSPKLLSRLRRGGWLLLLCALTLDGCALGRRAEHEAARLRLAEETTGQAVAEVEWARSRMQAAREARHIEESRHAAESVRQTIAARSQWQQAAVARAQLAAQLTALDAQLEQLAAVRAPFAGRVERVTWEEQHDQMITVVHWAETSLRLAADLPQALKTNRLCLPLNNHFFSDMLTANRT